MGTKFEFAFKRKGLKGDKEDKCCIKDLNLTIALGVDPGPLHQEHP